MTIGTVVLDPEYVKRMIRETVDKFLLPYTRADRTDTKINGYVILFIGISSSYTTRGWRSIPPR